MQETALNEAWMERKAIAAAATLVLGSIALHAQAQAPATCALPSFKEAINIDTGTGVADFNGDGALDLVIANNHSNSVSILLGDGKGRFESKVNVRVGTNPRKLAVGDLNGDNKADIVTPNTGSDNVSILINSCTP
jgi:hypothetical protein